MLKPKAKKKKIALPCKVLPDWCDSWKVVDRNGGEVFQLISSEQHVVDLCSILNRGIGPEGDAIEAELDQLHKERADRKRMSK